MAKRFSGFTRGAIALSVAVLVDCSAKDSSPSALTSADAAALPGLGSGVVSGSGGTMIASAGDAALTPVDAASPIQDAGQSINPTLSALDAGAYNDAAALDADSDAGAGVASLDADVGNDAAMRDAGTDSDAGAGDAARDAAPATGAFPPVSDLVAAGPYRAVTVTRSGPGSAYTIYHPESLAPGGIKNPFLTWGNGVLTTPDWYELLPHLASHGFVVIASNSSSVTPDDLRAGIDWLFAENERAGSIFFGKLDTSRVASVGYSLGSNGTFQIADDPRLTTTVHISGGAFDKADTAKLRKPTIFLCGAAGGDGYTTGDVAHENCESDFEVSAVPTFYGVFNGGGHLGVMLSPHMERIRGAVTGWLRWRLMGDQTLAPMFVGSSCKLCSDPNWTVKQKQL